MRVKSTLRRGLSSTLIMLLAIASMQLAAADTHYRWQDGRGNPVYSDRPPPKGTEYEVISARSGLKRVVSADEGAVPAEVVPRPGNEFDQVDEAQMGRSKKNPEFCQTARNNLATLNKPGRIRLRNDQGELRYLDEEQIAAERAKAEESIRQFCD